MSLARDVTTVGSATLLSRVLALLRDVGIAAALGAGALSDAYFAALQIPNLFRRLLGEGALNAAFVPIWLRLRGVENPAATRALSEQIFSVILLVLGLLSVVCVLFAPLVIDLVAPGFRTMSERHDLAATFVRLSAPYIVLAGLVAVGAAILNAEGRVAAAAFAVAAFNSILILAVAAVLAFGGASTWSAEVLSAAMVVAGLVQLVLIGVALVPLPQRPRRFSLQLSSDARRFLARALPGVFAGGIPQLTLMAGVMIVSSSQASVSWLSYASRLYELPLGLTSGAIASVLGPRIAASVLRGDRSAMAQEQARTLEIALGLALPAAMGFVVLSHAIAGGLFERGAFGPQDTAAVAAALSAICAGLPGHVLEKALGAVSFAHEDTRTPMFAALGGLAAAVILGLLLFPRYGHVGVAAAIALSGWIGATTLVLVLRWRGWLIVGGRILGRLGGIALATAVMGIAVAAGDRWLATWLHPAGSGFVRLASLTILVTVGVAIYLISLQILGIARARELIAAVRKSH